MSDAHSPDRSNRLNFSLNRRHWLQGIGLGVLGSMIGLSVPASASSKTLNVQDYGATGDGETDDAPAIMDAINDAEDGDTIFFPEPDNAYAVYGSDGILLIDGDRHAADLTLEGENEDTTLRVHPDVSSNHQLFRITGAEDYSITIRKFDLDGNRANLSSREGSVIGQGVVFRDTTIQGPPEGILVEDVIARNFDQSGFSIQYGGVTLRHCTAHSNWMHGFGTNTNWGNHTHEPRPLIEHCHGYNNSEGSGGYGFDPSGGSSIVRDCVSEDNNLHGCKNSEFGMHHSWERIRIEDNFRMGYFNTENEGNTYSVDMEDMVIRHNGNESIRPRAGIDWTFSGEFILHDNAELSLRDMRVEHDCNVHAEDAEIYINGSNADDCYFHWGSSGEGTIGAIHAANNAGTLCDHSNVTILEQTSDVKTDLDHVPTADEVGAFVREIETVADFAVTISSTNSPVGVVDPIEVEVDVENIGDATGYQDLRLDVNGEEVDVRDVPMTAGEAKTITLTWQTDVTDVGDHSITVSSDDASDSADVTVEDRAVFAIDSLDVPGTVGGGDSLEVTASVTNIGGEAGEDDLWLAVGESEMDSSSLSLSPDESDEVSLVWETSVDDVGEQTITVGSSLDSMDATLTVQEAAVFEVEIISANTPVEAGGYLDVTAEITNIGEATATKDLTLEALDQIVDTQALEVSGGDTDEVTLTWSPNEADVGTWTVSVHSPDASANLDVEVIDPVLVEVAFWSMNAPIDPGETLEVEAGVTNLGTVEAVRDIRLEIDEDEVDSDTVTIGSGSVDSVDLVWETTEDDVGEYEVTLRSDQHSVSEVIQVGDPADDSADDSADDTADDTTQPPADDADDDADGLPGFGIGSAIAGMGGMAYMVKRRLSTTKQDE